VFLDCDNLLNPIKYDNMIHIGFVWFLKSFPGVDRVTVHFLGAGKSELHKTLRVERSG
jgi:hypothetical protein